jgi:LAO/AO transport system kinase
VLLTDALAAVDRAPAGLLVSSGPMATTRDDGPEALLDAARAGDRSALAKLVTEVERGGEDGRAVSRVVHPESGGTYTVGITGAPGAGKSTLTSALVGEVRAHDERVAVVAIDPSSPFTGGAILGDRVRMSEHALDDGVFIRSMATRGHLGGLTLATPEAIRVLDAAGWPWVLVETVGVGQVEVEIAGSADTTVVVVNPGWGDAVQANKAGLMEIADIFVINKADRPGAAETRRDLVQMLELAGVRGRSDWEPPVVDAVATTGHGADELWVAIGRHRDHVTRTGRLEQQRTARLTDELRHLLAARLMEQAMALSTGATFDSLRADVAARRLDPWTAVDRLLDP